MRRSSSHQSVEGQFSPNGQLICGTPGCGKMLGVATKDGQTILRCPGCKADNMFSIPLYLARALENSCQAQVKLAEAFAIVANLTMRNALPEHI